MAADQPGGEHQRRRRLRHQVRLRREVSARLRRTGGQGGNAVTGKRADFGYGANDWLEQVTRRENGALVVDSTWSYDDLSWLTGLTHAGPGGTLAAYQWSFDAANRIVYQQSSADGGTDYSYDARGQLTAADHAAQADESYAYDDNGNRTEFGYATGARNRITSDGQFDYTYDAEGQRTTRTSLATGAVTEYAWDAAHRLIQVRERPAAGAAVNSDGKNIHIRLDKPAIFGGPAGKGDQGWHFNAGPAFEKLKQHHYFEY